MNRATPGWITERDRNLFQFLHESRVATFHQIKNRIFKNVSRQMASRRIGLLRRGGWLTPFAHLGERRTCTAFGLSDKAFQKFVRLEGVNDRIVQLASDKLSHDVTLVNLRERLEKSSKIIRVYPENYLQSHQECIEDRNFRDSVSLNSDAVLEIKVDDIHVFVPFEYEGSAKSEERWERKFRQYYRTHDSSVVLWVCKNEAMIKKMASVDLEFTKDYTSKMFFASLERVLTNSSQMIFLNSPKTKRIEL